MPPSPATLIGYRFRHQGDYLWTESPSYDVYEGEKILLDPSLEGNCEVQARWGAEDPPVP